MKPRSKPRRSRVVKLRPAVRYRVNKTRTTGNFPLECCSYLLVEPWIQALTESIMEAEDRRFLELLDLLREETP